MSVSAGQRRRPYPARQAVLAGLAASMLCIALSGCSSSAPQKRVAVEEEEEPEFLLDRIANKAFQEAATKLPPPPKDSDLVPIEVDGNTRLAFAVDTKSVVIGEDGAVRYTIVATSPSGARNISHEGVRCDTFERKLFATMPPGRDTWVPNLSQGQEQWRRMTTSVRNSYAAALATDYLCDGKSTAGKAEDIVRAMKQQTPATDSRRMGR